MNRHEPAGRDPRRTGWAGGAGRAALFAAAALLAGGVALAQALDAPLPDAQAPNAQAPKAQAPNAQSPEAPTPEAAPPSDSPPTGESRLSFHAFVNVAYARSDSHQILGIPKDGTTDYRTVALQMRYSLGAADEIVVQLIENRLGASAINNVRGGVGLELAFYEHRFKDSTTVRLGKMQLPMGIYNEIRDVGTLLPFFAPPDNIYDEQNTARDVEGAMVSHTFEIPGKWSVDADLYGGGWSTAEENVATETVNVFRAENVLGTQLWLMTPVTGLRFGVSAFREDAKGRLSQVNRLDLLQAVTVSVDGTFSRFFIRGEYLHADTPERLSAFFVVPHLIYKAYYGQVGLDLTRRLSFNLQATAAHYNLSPGTPDLLRNDDYAASLVFKFRSNLVAKIEGHRSKGQLAEDEPAGPITYTTYGLVSFAASF